MRAVLDTSGIISALFWDGAPRKVMNLAHQGATSELVIYVLPKAKRLASLRKERGYTQQVMADQIGIHVSQYKRYEGGDSQPTLEVIRNLAIALSVSADVLIFDTAERGPDDSLKFQFETISQFEDDDKRVAQAVLEGLILKHQAKQSLQRQNTKS
jgi:transcriptional regulator with XRE-family HTH domain